MKLALVLFVLIPPLFRANSLSLSLNLSFSQRYYGHYFLCLCAQCLPEEHTRIWAPQSLLTFDLGLLLPVSSTVANMYKYRTALQAVCVLQVWRAREEGRKRGSYLIPPKGTPLSTRIVNSQANRVAWRHTTHTLLSFSFHQLKEIYTVLWNPTELRREVNYTAPWNVNRFHTNCSIKIPHCNKPLGYDNGQ